MSGRLVKNAFLFHQTYMRITLKYFLQEIRLFDRYGSQNIRMEFFSFRYLLLRKKLDFHILSYPLSYCILIVFWQKSALSSRVRKFRYLYNMRKKKHLKTKVLKIFSYFENTRSLREDYCKLNLFVIIKALSAETCVFVKWGSLKYSHEIKTRQALRYTPTYTAAV